MRQRPAAGSIIPWVALAALLPLSGRGAPEPKGPAHEAYEPGLGDFMTAYVQPHHLKLWFAGVAGNWELAAYEARELDETFDDVVSYQSRWHDLPIRKLVQSLIRPQIKRVSDAIAAKDFSQFRRTYEDLNSACNGCHQAAGHGFIEIAVPSDNPYADQRMGPAQAPAQP